MGLGKVGDVNIVPDTGSIRRIIIRAEDGDRFPSQGGQKADGNEMSLLRMVFSQLAPGVGACCIKVSQGDVIDFPV